jgi:hypothetical protein
VSFKLKFEHSLVGSTAGCPARFRSAGHFLCTPRKNGGGSSRLGDDQIFQELAIPREQPCKPESTLPAERAKLMPRNV